MLGTGNNISTTNGGSLAEGITGYVRWYFPVVIWRDKLGR